MVTYENQCVDCGKPCLYDSCPHYSVRVLICDRCGEYEDKLYCYGGEELCGMCALEELEVVK
jgi:hypothetical protein